MTKQEIIKEWRKTNHGETLQQYFTPEQNDWLEDWWLSKITTAVEERDKEIEEKIKEWEMENEFEIIKHPQGFETAHDGAIKINPTYAHGYNQALRDFRSSIAEFIKKSQ